MALAHDIIVQHLEDFGRRRDALARLHERGLIFLADDLHAQFDAFIADEHRRARNELANLVLALSAEGAIEGVLGLRSTRLAHPNSFQTDPGQTASGPTTVGSQKPRQSGGAANQSRISIRP